MLLSLRNKVFLNSFLAITLAFFFPLAAATFSYASLTPAQRVASLQQDSQLYTGYYNTYLAHYQAYAPNSVSDLATFSAALTSFNSAVSSASSALSAFNTATSNLTSAQNAITNLPNLISTSQQALTTAQANYDAASISFNAVAPSYSQALQNRNDAWSAYQATVVNQSVIEEFTGNQVTSNIQFLVGGTTPISSTGNPRISSQFIFVDQYGPGLEIKPPTGMTPTTLGFKTYARNGDQQVTVTFNDDSTGTFLNPNGVGNPNCPDYWCTLSYTAPEGKTIKSFFIPGDWDILYLDNFTFSANSYNQAAYDNYLAKQAALDAITSTYNSANSALSSATSALAAAQSAYDTYSNPNYLTSLEASRDSYQAEVSSTSATLETTANYATTLRQPMIDAYLAINLPPSSLEVTSTADTSDPGTLRWAITQANAQSGGIYDNITIKTTTPIVLSSALPIITQNLAVTGQNRATSIIDGAGTFTAFDIRNSSLTLNLSNVTIQNTYAADWQRGSALWVVRGTANVTNVHFTNISQGTAVTTKEGGSYINITNSLFTSNNQGVFSNFGSTPSTTTASDNQYDNRITINTTTFSNNSTAIYGERTVLVDNSTFNSNGYAFRMQGINKHRVTNSTFDGNTVAIYTNSWIPTSWTTFFANPPQGRVIHNNIFRNTTQKVIMLNDFMNDGKSNQQGASIQNNSWDGDGLSFVEYYQHNTTFNSNYGYVITSATDSNTHPFAFSGNVSIAPFIAAPTNLQATANPNGSVSLTWTAAQAQNIVVERYAVFFTTGDAPGWAVASMGTSITIDASTFVSSGGRNATYSFKVRADNDTYGVYSAFSSTVSAFVTPAPAPTPTPTPTPTQSPQPTVSPTPTPTPTPQPEPTPTPTPTPEPEITPEPTPTPTPTPEPTPTEPEPTPTEDPTPEPTQTPEPTPTPTPTPTEKPTPKPEPTPTITPTPTPQPSPTPEPKPTPTPKPTKEPTPTEKPVVVEIKEPITAENITAVVAELATIQPQQLTQEQQTLIQEAALQTFETATQGSPEYQAALDALLVVAQADDIVIDEELAAVPLVGAAAVAVAEVFNALGNAGADMSPQVREQSEKVVIAAVIVGQIAMTATTAATSAAAAAARRP